MRLHEWHFADDAELLGTICTGAEEYTDVAAAFGLRMSRGKTKLMVVGAEVSAEQSFHTCGTE